MESTFTFWFPVYPDLTKAIGGVKQIHRVAEILLSFGHNVFLVQEDASFRPSWFQSDVPTISKAEWLSSPNLLSDTDVIVYPETFLPIVNDNFSHVRKIIFNQNAAYTFGVSNVDIWPPNAVLNAYQNSAITQVWCVSKHDYTFLSRGLCLDPNKLFLLSNGIETHQFVIPQDKKKKYQVCFMPRKNSRDSSIVSSLLQKQTWFNGFQLIPIQNLSHDDVLCVLQESVLFLSFGHPEGFGLPIAEAMACGCSVVGYSGLGGREIFNIGISYNLAVEVDFGDWLGFLDGVRSILAFLKNSPSEYISNAHSMSAKIRSTYSMLAFQNSVKTAISSLE